MGRRRNTVKLVNYTTYHFKQDAMNYQLKHVLWLSDSDFKRSKLPVCCDKSLTLPLPFMVKIIKEAKALTIIFIC